MLSEQNLDFSILPLPRIHFGASKLSVLASSVTAYGRHLLLVTGKSTLQRSPSASGLLDELHRAGIEIELLAVTGEPSPELIDKAVKASCKRPFDAVAAIGGGSVLDAGKAISAMLLQTKPVERFIEGRPGVLPHDGRKVPFIAVPTTSGTGSEVTNNSVISRVGPGGFKRSLRHPAFVPDVAIIDPELMVTLPHEVTVSTGMDALTQLLEAYLSPIANPYTDAVACSGLERFARSFEAASGECAGSVAVRGDIAYAALMSGIALANAGLGIVHGFASSVGGLFDIPHGTLCATLLAEATRENIRQLQASGDGAVGLRKFANASRILTGELFASEAEAYERLVEKLESWQEQFAFPRLGEFGVSEGDFEEIVTATRAKGNATPLDAAAMRRILAARV